MKKTAFYAGVFVLCATVMALQILQSRLFSVVTWYHLSFLVISVTMFGLTFGAVRVYRGDEAAQRGNLPALLSQCCFNCSVAVIVSLAAQMYFPIIYGNAVGTLVTLPLIAGITSCAYFYAGQAIALCLTRTNLAPGHVYAADLLGAATGCLGALALMKTMDAPSAIVLLSAVVLGAGILFARSDSPSALAANGIAARRIRLYGGVAVALAGLGLANASLDKPFLYTLWTKNVFLPQSQIHYEKWNAISRVTVTDSSPAKPVFLWGPSPLLPKSTKAEYRYLAIDGDAGTPITAFDGKSWGGLKYLEYDVTNTAYALPGLKTGAIIGLGGGRDLLSALYFGLKDVTALDVNATQIDLLTRHPFYSAYAGLANQTGVRIINSEARSWLTRADRTFDIIQMSLIDTWASTGAGAFALSENSLYTVDAFRIFLNDLNGNGVLTVSRWYTESGFNELARLTGLAVAALLERGAADPSRHIFIVQSGLISTLIVGKDPLTRAQIDALDKTARRFQYTIIAAPDTPPANPILKAIVEARTVDGIADSSRGTPWNLSPSTDMKPFFFNQAHVLRPFEIFRLAFAGNEETIRQGNFKATINLYLIIAFSMALATILLIPSMKSVSGGLSRRFIAASSAYFAMIGLGFMLIEISLMQIMSMFLGHPTYGLGIVLFTLILAAGIGSYVSEWIRLDKPLRFAAWASVTALYAVFLSLALDPLLKNLASGSFETRTLICVGLLFPCGFLLGFAFPSGMSLAMRVSPGPGPWLWAVNGAAGVIASALAVLCGIAWGLDKTLMAGAALYLCLCVPGTILIRCARDAKGPA